MPEIHNILNKPNINYSKTLTKYLVQHANCITDPELFLSRFNFTSKFLRHSAHIFEYGKIRDGLGELSNKYDIEMSFPLVGALRIGEEKIGFYMISYCRTESDMPEKTVWEEIDKIMSPVFKRETAQEILYKCKKEFGCLTNHMYLKRMVVKSKSVQNSFVIFHFGVFSNTIMQEADLPIDLLYRYINNDLREWWNAYSPPGVSSWEQIPISDNVAK